MKYNNLNIYMTSFIFGTLLSPLGVIAITEFCTPDSEPNKRPGYYRKLKKK